MSFFAELKRRNVVRVGIAYAVIGWVLAQIAEFAFENFGAPDWALKTFVVALMLGLPLALFFAWAFEITPEGVKREKDVDRSQSITSQTSRKLDFIIIGVLVIGVVVLLADKFVVDEQLPEVGEIVATESQSIAVLPFVNMSEDNDHFADGLSEELLNLLAKLPDLKVAARTSSFEFKGRNDDLREIGHALGVNHVLEGSVRRSGDRLRITAQLIKVDDGFHVWSNSYDREMADIFDIQDDVAGAITGALKLRLTTSSNRPTDSTDAYAAYLEALPLLESTDGDYRPAIELLNQAISYDPEFAKAYEAKTIVYWNVTAWTLAADQAQALIYEAASRAFELDPSLVIARTYRTTANPDTWTWVEEVLGIDRAYREQPNDPRILGTLAYDLITSGYFEEALDVSRRHVELDPLSTIAHINVGKALTALGRYELAHRSWDRLAELDAAALSADFKITGYLQADEIEKAIVLGEEAVEKYGLQPKEFRSFVEKSMNPESGREYLTRYVDAMVAEASNFQEATDPYFWYLHFGYLDDYWQAIETIDPVSSSTWSNAENLEHFGVVYWQSGFTRHPSYFEYQEKYKMTELWDQRGAPDFCNKDSGEWVCN